MDWLQLDFGHCLSKNKALCISELIPALPRRYSVKSLAARYSTGQCSATGPRLVADLDAGAGPTSYIILIFSTFAFTLASTLASTLVYSLGGWICVFGFAAGKPFYLSFSLLFLHLSLKHIES